jgi:3'-5' exoribonuclease
MSPYYNLDIYRHRYAFLSDLIGQLKSPYKELNSELLNDSEFSSCPGSTGKHHAYPTGLLQHTYEVMTFVFSNQLRIKDFDPNIAATAILWHDAGKRSEYQDYQIFEGQLYNPSKSEYGKMDRHIPRSLADFGAAFKGKISEKDYNYILHLISSHHGRLDWGSPSIPGTDLAWLIHCGDMLSARYGTGVLT